MRPKGRWLPGSAENYTQELNDHRFGARTDGAYSVMGAYRRQQLARWVPRDQSTRTRLQKDIDPADRKPRRDHRPTAGGGSLSARGAGGGDRIRRGRPQPILLGGSTPESRCGAQRGFDPGLARFWEPLEPLRESGKLGPVPPRRTPGAAGGAAGGGDRLPAAAPSRPRTRSRCAKGFRPRSRCSRRGFAGKGPTCQ